MIDYKKVNSIVKKYYLRVTGIPIFNILCSIFIRYDMAKQKTA
jgi:hypothetical protein